MPAGTMARSPPIKPKSKIVLVARFQCFIDWVHDGQLILRVVSTCNSWQICYEKTGQGRTQERLWLTDGISHKSSPVLGLF